MAVAAIASDPRGHAEESIEHLQDETLAFLSSHEGEAALVALVDYLQPRGTAVELLSRALAILLRDGRIRLTTDRRILLTSQ